MHSFTDVILVTSNLLTAGLSIYFIMTDFNLLKRISSITSTIRSVLDDNDNEIHFTSLEDTDDPDLLYNSMKIESDAKDKQIREMELSTPGRTDIFNFEMNDFSDFENDDDRRGEKSMRIKTPFHSI
jgi:hypothetical protein